MTTQQIANRLVELCRAGEYDKCYDELFSEDTENIEMPAMADGPLGNARGLDAIRRKARAWEEGIEQVHGGHVGDPVVAGNWFCVPMSMDASFRQRGRMQIEELCVYQVKDGRIVREQFFYDT